MGQLQKVSWRAVGYSALGTALAAASVIAIVNSDGVRPTSLTSNAATRWLVDQVNDTAVLVDGLAGRVVARIQTESDAGDEVAVQGAGGAFLVAKGEGSLRTISTAKLQLGTAQAVGLLLQPDAVLGVGASGLTIVSPDADKANVVAVDDATRPIEIPVATDSYVAADGSMWLLDDTVATHVNVDQTASTMPLRSAADQTITIGVHAVAFDSKNSTVRWLDGGDVRVDSIPNASEAVLQQSGDDAACVWLGVGDRLACVGKTGIDRTLVVQGLNITSGDRLAVAGTAAAIISETNEVTRIDLEREQLADDVPPSVRSNARADDHCDRQPDLARRRGRPRSLGRASIGINPIQKNDDNAPLLDAQGQITTEGGAGAGQSPGTGDASGDDETDHLDGNGHDDPPTAVDDSVTARSGSTVIIPVTGNDYGSDDRPSRSARVGLSRRREMARPTCSTRRMRHRCRTQVQRHRFIRLHDRRRARQHGFATVNVQLFPPDTPNRPR